MKVGQTIRKILYKTLSFETYLLTLSKMYFFSFRLGFLKNKPAFKYPYFLKNLVKTGNTVLDIGANLGYYATLFSSLVGKEGKVLCVEPVKPVLKVLRRNTKRCKNLEVFPYALGQENKSIMLGNDSVKEKGFVATGSHFVLDKNNTDNENAELEFNAEMKKGSELFANLTKLDFIKCDIEGYEVVVLPELKPVIAKFKPTVLVESSIDKKAILVEFFSKLNYDVFVLNSNNLLEIDNPKGTDDVVFMHKEKQAEFIQYFSK